MSIGRLIVIGVAALIALAVVFSLRTVMMPRPAKAEVSTAEELELRREAAEAARQRELAFVAEQERLRAEEAAAAEEARLKAAQEEAARRRDEVDRQLAEQQKHVREADERAWAAATGTNTIPAYWAYLQQFPDGAHAGEAKGRIPQTSGPTPATRADSAAWASAQSIDTVAAYSAYLIEYPNGRYANNARVMLAALSGPASAPSPAAVIQSQIAALGERLGPLEERRNELRNELTTYDATHHAGFLPEALERTQLAARLATATAAVDAVNAERTRLIMSLPSGGGQSAERDGRYAYSAPGVMVKAEPYFLSVAVTPLPDPAQRAQVDERLAQDVRETVGDAAAPVRAGDVRIGGRMKATLDGAGFDVAASSEVDQTVDPAGVTRWVWEVRPKAAGRQPLVMKLWIKGENGAADREVRVVPAIIDVRDDDAVFRNQEQLAQRQRAGVALESAASFAADTAALARQAPAGAGGGAFARPANPCATGAGQRGRMALVVSNQNYVAGIVPLSFATQDGEAMRDVLAEAGFRVTHCRDLGADDMERALTSFRDEVRAASNDTDVAVAFYYAGHGASTPAKGETYLLPVSLRQANAALIEAQGVSIDAVVAGLSSAGARQLVVVIDACRDVLKMDGGDYRGLNMVSWRTTAFDVVAYATMWGEKARDNGLYARALAKWIRAMPGEDIAAVLNKVQTEVSDATSEAQVPQYNDRMPGVFALKAR